MGTHALKQRILGGALHICTCTITANTSELYTHHTSVLDSVLSYLPYIPLYEPLSPSFSPFRSLFLAVSMPCSLALSLRGSLSLNPHFSFSYSKASRVRGRGDCGLSFGHFSRQESKAWSSSVVLSSALGSQCFCIVQPLRKSELLPDYYREK